MNQMETTNEMLTDLERAADLIREGVELAYTAFGGEDVHDIGLGFADTTADNLFGFIRREREELAKRSAEAIAKRRAELAEKVPESLTGYLLETSADGGDTWRTMEFDAGRYPNAYSFWQTKNEITDEWERDELHIGLFSDLPGVWVESSDSWVDRFSVDFDARTTPKTDPHECGIWGGVGLSDELWRVRRITITDRLSDKAIDFLAKWPEVKWEVYA